MDLFRIFGTTKPVIAMLHAPPLPGSPRSVMSFDRIVESVLKDAETLAAGGVDGFLVENFGDAPYFPRRVPAHTVSFLTALSLEVRRRFALPLGVNILRNDAASALAVAAAVGAQFVRVNVYVGARLTDQGMIEGVAHHVLRYRKFLGSDVRVFADADVKHSAPLASRDLSQEVEEIFSRGCADAVIITGAATGKQILLDDLKTAKGAAGGSAVIAGSGVDPKNAVAVLGVADAAIVGTALKRNGVVANPVDAERVRELMNVVKSLRDDFKAP